MAACGLASNNQPEAIERGRLMKEYKVLTQKDRWFGGKFEPLKIEAALNAYGQRDGPLRQLRRRTSQRCSPAVATS